jgi:hypothetical protein
VSMNLWGFAPPMWGVLATAMREATDASEDAEVLLPELVGRVVHGELGDPSLRRFAVLSTSSRCIGVTHPDDLDLVRAEIAAEVGAGVRPARPFAP